MKKLWTALLSAILCCSLAFGAVSVCAETGGDTNVVPVLTTETRKRIGIPPKNMR